MLIKPMISLSLTALAGLFLTLSAEAKPKFTIENETWENIRVETFNGDDPLCASPLKSKVVSKFDSRSFTCKGGGTGKCKVRVYVNIPNMNNRLLCRTKSNTCNGHGIKVKDGATLKLTPKFAQGADDDEKLKVYYHCEID